MHSDFPIRALMEEQSARERLIEGEKALAALNRVGSVPHEARSSRDVQIVSGNRHERRKAEKLLRKKG